MYARRLLTAVTALTLTATPLVAAAQPPAPSVEPDRRDDLRDLHAARASRTRPTPTIAPAVVVVEPPVASPAPRVRKPAPRRVEKPGSVRSVVPASGAAAIVVRWSMAQVGKPYVYGAAGPSSFDCSGLILASYRQVGISLPHKAAALYGYGHAVPVGQWQPGDVIVMDGGGHAGIYVGNGLMVEAANPRAGVRVTKTRGGSARRLL